MSGTGKKGTGPIGHTSAPRMNTIAPPSEKSRITIAAHNNDEALVVRHYAACLRPKCPGAICALNGSSGTIRPHRIGHDRVDALDQRQHVSAIAEPNLDAIGERFLAQLPHGTGTDAGALA